MNGRMALVLASVGLVMNASAQHCVLDPTVQSGCIADNNGWAFVTAVIGGTAPYTYLWNNGDTAAYQAGLANGTYTVEITDANGCVVMDTAVVDCIFFSDCEYRTFTQGGWGANPHGDNPGVYLHEHFASCFTKGITIGCGGNTLTLFSAQAVTDFLPSGTTGRPLPGGSMVDPGNSYKNVLAGQLVATILNVRFDVCDPSFSEANGALGLLTFNGGPFDGLTVNAVIALANSFLGGCGSPYTAAQFVEALTSVNENYNNGTDQGGLLCNAMVQPHHLHAEEGPVHIGVFPVPAQDNITVQLATNNGDAWVMLVDATGRTLIDRRTVPAGRMELDVAALPAGLYHLLVQQNNERQEYPVMITR